MTLDELKDAVARLGPEERAEFRTWFDEFLADLFDVAIERDIAAGKLDELAEKALEEFAAGRAASSDLQNETASDGL